MAPEKMHEYSIVAIYASHDDAEVAVKSLKTAGVDMSKLSIIGKDFQAEERSIGFFGGADGVIARALMNVGIPKESASKREVDVKAGGFLVLAQGTLATMERARSVLRASTTSELNIYAP